MRIHRLIPLLLCATLLIGCTTEQQAATPSDATVMSAFLGFLTVDGYGIAEHPFSREPEHEVEWLEGEMPLWTALPIWVSGTVEEDGTITNAAPSSYSYTVGTNDTADAYYNIIVSGSQEKFEDLWTEVYNKLNGVEEFSAIDSTPLQEILDYVYGDEKYGYLQDILTEGLVLIKDINENGPSAEYDESANKIYNNFYAWLYAFSTSDL